MIVVDENPILNFKKAAICLHLSSAGAERHCVKNDGPAHSCDHFWSFEKDILKEEFRNPAPFYTRFINKQVSNVTIHFPEEISVVSEGEKRTYRCRESHRARPASARLGYTHFLSSGIRIWHLILTSTPDSHFTEFDLIKLSSLYGGLQEKVVCKDAISFSLEMGPRLGVKELVDALYKSRLNKDTITLAGTIDLEVDTTEDCFKGWDSLITSLNELKRGNAHPRETFREIENIVESDSECEARVMALCGVVSGIFHFDRYYLTEITDTLDPLVAMNSELIAYINHTLSVIDTIISSDNLWRTMGITPYMLIPHSVLIHNRLLINRVISDTDKALKTNKSHRMKDLERVRTASEKGLNIDFVPNPFKYRTERLLFLNGFSRTGGVEKRKWAGKKLSEVNARIAVGKRRSELHFMWSIGFISAFFAGFGFQPVADDLFKDWWDQNKYLEWTSVGVFFGVTVILLLVVFWRGRCTAKD